MAKYPELGGEPAVIETRHQGTTVLLGENSQAHNIMLKHLTISEALRFQNCDFLKTAKTSKNAMRSRTTKPRRCRLNGTVGAWLQETSKDGEEAMFSDETKQS